MIEKLKKIFKYNETKQVEKINEIIEKSYNPFFVNIHKKIISSRPLNFEDIDSTMKREFPLKEQTPKTVFKRICKGDIKFVNNGIEDFSRDQASYQSFDYQVSYTPDNLAISYYDPSTNTRCQLSLTLSNYGNYVWSERPIR